jgi:hypothetical protein
VSIVRIECPAQLEQLWAAAEALGPATLPSGLHTEDAAL